MEIRGVRKPVSLCSTGGASGLTRQASTLVSGRPPICGSTCGVRESHLPPPQNLPFRDGDEGVEGGRRGLPESAAWEPCWGRGAPTLLQVSTCACVGTVRQHRSRWPQTGTSPAPHQQDTWKMCVCSQDGTRHSKKKNQLHDTQQQGRTSDASLSKGSTSCTTPFTRRSRMATDRSECG